MAEPKRRRAWAFGARAERVARLLLRCKGYRIVARRYRTPLGEIDIVARRGKTLAFVEVKARPSREQAAEAISRHQQARIERAAGAFIGRHPDCAGLDLRFDVILIAPGRWPAHLPDAWRPRQ